MNRNKVTSESMPTIRVIMDFEHAGEVCLGTHESSIPVRAHHIDVIVDVHVVMRHQIFVPRNSRHINGHTSDGKRPKRTATKRSRI